MAKKSKKKESSFKVGDKIIDFGQVYSIFKVKQKKGADGKKKKFIFYRPYFKTRENKGLVFSIPFGNVKKANIRKPLPEKELKKLFDFLSKKLETKKSINVSKAEDRLNLNDPYKTGRILKRLWLEKKDESRNFTRSKKRTFKLAMQRLVQEVAFVKDFSLKEAREKVKKALDKAVKKTQKESPEKKKK